MIKIIIYKKGVFIVEVLATEEDAEWIKNHVKTFDQLFKKYKIETDFTENPRIPGGIYKSWTTKRRLVRIEDD